MTVSHEPTPAGGEGRRLADLRARLIALHKILLDDQRAAYEAQHGPVASQGALLRLVLDHADFGWLRRLSEIIVDIDAALDERERRPGALDADGFLRQVRSLLRSEASGPFETRYRDVLQRSPDAVLAHAAVMKLL